MGSNIRSININSESSRLHLRIMKLNLSIINTILAVTAVCVSAGTFVSPAPGSTIAHTESFNFTWVSSRYFKESSNSVTVLLGANWDFFNEGLVLAQDLAPVAPGEGESGPTYYGQLTPTFVASSSHTGQFQLVVVENYNAYGVALFCSI
ncbi:hypothetical protein D9757_000461 [Collybiopsis confluens]|uniref:Uncharacterized protein n=1 Tax=Collybiopsis confluens TaxID=2823264 RepID=A0A8H5I1Q9_9AGAR|nr:hypothetical protein D9757_000461 [Collybiopsis confluens]